MSDMITAEAADFAWPVGGYAPGGYMCKCSTCGKTHMAEKRAWQCADCVIKRLHAQLADAKAAQAMVVERAAGVADTFADQSESDAALWRKEGMPKTATVADEHAKAGRMVAENIRALADTDGLALVQALRERALHAEDRVGKLEAALSGGVLSNADASDLLSRLAVAEAERDRLAAANAALEAQVARLVGALQSIADSDDMAAELFTNDADRANNYADRARAALAEVQADARREGGE